MKRSTLGTEKTGDIGPHVVDFFSPLATSCARLPRGPRNGHRQPGAEGWRLSGHKVAQLGGAPGWKAALIEATLAEQKPDGRWENPSPLQKENDPIVATSLALTALARCL